MPHHPAIPEPHRGGWGSAGPKTTCCGPCRDQDFCRDENNCCLECHFHYEEALAFPYIPEEGRRILSQQHAWLIANRFPHHELEAHAQYEMLWFKPYCPPEIIAQIDDDHAEYGEGRLTSRDGQIVAPPPLYAPPPPLIVPPPLPAPVQDNWMGQRATLGVAHGYVGRTALGASGYRTW